MQRITPDQASEPRANGRRRPDQRIGRWACRTEALLAAVGQRFRNERQPRELTSISVVGIGDRISLGADHLAQAGLIKRAISGALIDSPGLLKMAASDQIEAYTLPQGVLSQLMREMAGGDGRD